MPPSTLLPCDGCGQLADSAHISRRLERLAWTTRFRPLHIQALLLSSIAPKNNSDFLYSPNESFHGEATTILQAVQISAAGKSPESVQTEFQKLGLMLTHVLECPFDDNVSPAQAQNLLAKQLLTAVARIRRSLKPKRLLLLSAELLPLVDQFHNTTLGCPILPASGVFLPASAPSEADLQAFRTALAIVPAPAV
ncbi:MAG: hypothetical protein WAM58_06455 [Candidatus Acidiferrum sp.]